MNKILLGSAVAAALMAEHVSDEGAKTGATVASLTKGKPLSGVVIKAFFDGSDAKKVAEKVAAAESSRLQYLMRTFPESSLEQVKAAVKEYKEMAAKEGGDSKEARKVVTARTAEVQSLYGAWRWADFMPEGMGYHAAVSEARKILRSKLIRWDGAKVAEKWERDIRKDVEQKAQVELAARTEVARREKETGEPLTEEQEAAIFAKVQEQQAKADMIALGRGLHKKYGAEKCEQLIEALEEIISSEQQAEKDKAATAKQAKAA